MAYNPVVRFSVTAGNGLLLNSTVSDMNVVVDSDCFAGGSIDFTERSPEELHIQYLLQQCQAQFLFYSEVRLHPFLGSEP